MNLIRIFLVACFMGVVAVGGATAGERLSTGAIKKLFPGQFRAVVKGYSVKFVARSDGSLVGKHPASSDTGRWSIRRGRLCIMLKEWMEGKTSCSTVVHNDGWYRAEKVKFRKL